jgi:hypothetical protein
MKRFILEKSGEEFYTSHSGLALVGACINRFTDFKKRINDVSPRSGGISHADIARSYLGLLCLGKSDYDAITDRREDRYFQTSLGLSVVPSAETLRQRFDAEADLFRIVTNYCAVDFVNRARGLVTSLGNGYVPLDVDVFPMDNSDTKKEGVSRTYHGYDGYAPIAAYLGLEGWCLEVELREGKQHSQDEFIPFLLRVLSSARRLTQAPILVRLDGAHDALDTRAELAGHAGVDYVLKWNPRRQDEAAWLSRAAKEGRELSAREGKRVWLFSEMVPQKKDGENYTFRRVVRVTQRTIDKRGQCLLSPEITLEGWWTSLSADAFSDEEVIGLYQGHGTSEQFHSEFKTDLDIERLPSGKFATNALVLSMAAFAYNILRFIGQLGLLGDRTPVRHAAKRRRIKTVIQELIYLAARMIESGRRLKLRFSRHCPAFEAFGKVYGTLFAKPAYG